MSISAASLVEAAAPDLSERLGSMGLLIAREPPDAVGEDPWRTVQRECVEELHVPAVPSVLAGDRPFFLSVTQTRGAGEHIDASLWYVLSGDPGGVTSHGEREFAAVRWLTPRRVPAEPAERLDPHLHRFARKLTAALGR